MSGHLVAFYSLPFHLISLLLLLLLFFLPLLVRLLKLTASSFIRCIWRITVACVFLLHCILIFFFVLFASFFYPLFFLPPNSRKQGKNAKRQAHEVKEPGSRVRVFFCPVNTFDTKQKMPGHSQPVQSPRPSFFFIQFYYLFCFCHPFSWLFQILKHWSH